MVEVLNGDQEDLDIWFGAEAGEISEKQWREYFTRKNFVSTVNFPSALFYKELMVAFPEAKVVLSTRNSQSWYLSCYNTVYKLTELICSWPTKILVNALDEKKNMGEFHKMLKSKVSETLLAHTIRNPEIEGKISRSSYGKKNKKGRT